MIKEVTYKLEVIGSNPIINNFFSIFSGGICPPKSKIGPSLEMEVEEEREVRIKLIFFLKKLKLLGINQTVTRGDRVGSN